MPADLLMIVPTRGRPGNAKRLAEAFDRLSTGAADLLFMVDGDWPNVDAYRAATGGRCTVGPWRGMIATLNHLAVLSAYRYPMLGFCGDDHLPTTAGFDKVFVDELRRLGTGIVYGDDKLQGENLPTAVALTSDIVRTLGYMAPPGLRHLYCDNFWRDLGREVGRITYLPDVVIEHLHPTAGKTQSDAGYDRVNSSAATQADAAAWDTYLNVQFAQDIAAVKALL